jgi:hypothetical protein
MLYVLLGGIPNDCCNTEKREGLGMPLSVNKPKLDNLAGEIWKSAERLGASSRHTNIRT